MLQIRLSKGSSLDGGTGTKSSPVETVTVACPDHLVLADLPVAKGLGSATAASIVKVVGRRSRRQLGERVHFCVRCDFPIAVYGRLSPCEHAFCLDCARSDSICYLCDERIQKIQTIKMMEGIFICAAPHCLKSFLKKPDFESHIHHHHSDLLHPNAVKNEDQIEPDAFRGQHSTSSESNPRAPARPGFPPGSNPQFNDRDDKARAHTPRDQVPPRPLMHPNPNLNPASFYGPNNHTEIQHENRPEAGTHQDMGGQFPPMYPHLPPGFPVPGNPNGMLLNPPPFGFPPFPTDGGAPPAPLYGGGPAMLAPPLPPGPPPPHVVQQKQGWQPERRDSFGSSQD